MSKAYKISRRRLITSGLNTAIIGRLSQSFHSSR